MDKFNGFSNMLPKVISKAENEQALLDFGRRESFSGNWETAELCFEREISINGEF